MLTCQMQKWSQSSVIQEKENLTLLIGHSLPEMMIIRTEILFKRYTRSITKLVYLSADVLFYIYFETSKDHVIYKNPRFFIVKVFSTSPSPDSCTMGVWAAYDPRLQLIILDTEGKFYNEYISKSN